MHELLIAKYYPEAIATSGIKIRCPGYYCTKNQRFKGGMTRTNHDYDEYLVNAVRDVTGIQIRSDRFSEIDPFLVQFNFYRHGSRLAPHIDSPDYPHAVLVQIRGKKRLGFYSVDSGECSLYTSFKDATLLESVEMSPGDVIVMDNRKAVKLKIAHGVPTCKGNSATAVLTD